MSRSTIIFFLILIFSSFASASVNLSGTIVTDATDTEGEGLLDGRLALLVADITTTDPNATGTFVGDSQGGILGGSPVAVGDSFGSLSNVIFARTRTSAGPFSTAVVGVSDIVYPTGVAEGNPFGLYVFTNLPSDATNLSVGDSYGFYRSPTLGSESWNLPADGSTLTFGTQLSQGDEVGFGDLTVAIPEPSAYATILGLLGFGYAVFCRRRRSSSRE